MSNTPFPYLPSGLNFVPEISGSGFLGSASKPFATLYANQIQMDGVVFTPSGIAGDYVNISGDTMTGTLNAPVLSGTTISGLNYTVVSGGYVDFNIVSSNPTWAEGRVFYDNVDHTLAYYNDVNGITVNMGQEMLVRVRNTYSGTILNGQPVRINGAQGDRPTVTLASAANAHDSHVIGLVTEDILTGADGYAATLGLVHTFAKANVGLGAVVAGDDLYLSAVSGTLVVGEPAYPNYSVHVGTLTRTAGPNIEVYVSERAHPFIVLDGANTILGVNNSGTAQEYKTISGTNNLTVVNTAGLVNISGSLTPTFTTVNASVLSGTTISGLNYTVVSGGSFLPAISGTINLGTAAFPFSGLYIKSVNDSVIVKTQFLEEPTGSVNGINAQFYLAKTPYLGSLALFKNGALMIPSGVHSTTADYTLATSGITFVTPPVSGATLIAQSYGYLG